MENIKWLEKWYKEKCDGIWEHSYGIEIETLDNPGWYVKIDLNEVGCNKVKEYKFNQDEGDSNWIECFISDNVFTGCGDCCKLNDIIQIFRKWMESE